jgi:LuxR family maltose regulon positive regulatory protein
MSRALALVETSDERTYEFVEGAGAAALLETKLYAPRSRSALIGRPRLSEQLRDRAGRKLTLVAAPAGFGKTTLVASWLAETGVDGVAWLSLDPNDNDPRVFWMYVAHAVRKAYPHAGGKSIAQLMRGANIRTVVATLINELAGAENECVLVLDVYHVIDEAEIHRELTFLLDHLPPRVHVVITTRTEPPVGLPRLRARGELVEVRAADLRFTHDETSAFFSQAMALELSARDVDTLEQRTEGWIAGLKLAALSMKGRDDVGRFVDGFSGENRHVADYLVEEVLRSEPEEVRRFLLATCSLNRLTGPLCDAVAGQTRSQSTLEDLERRNLFVVALDDRREWFRYHHLFADVLQKQAAAADPDAVRAAHRRASVWYEQKGALADAIQHALAGGDSERSAELLADHWPEKDRSYASATWLTRVQALPDDVVRARPKLGMGFAWALLNAGELEAAELRLRDVERAVAADSPLATELASARIYLAQSRGEIPGTLEHAQRSLEGIPATDPAGRATGIALVAMAHWGRGELDAAHRTFSDALAAMRACGHDLDAIRGAFVLGDIRAAQGRLRDARAAYERGLAHVDESSDSASAETDELHLGLSELAYEWNDLGAAQTRLETLARRGESAAHKGNRQRWCVAMARLRAARGDIAGALELLGEAEKQERRDPLPRARPIPAIRTRLRIAQARLDDATAWMREAKVSADDDLSFLREYEHLTLARLSIARARPASEVVPFLERLQIAALTGGRVGSVIEILVLQSLAQQASGNARAALDPLVEALTFAEPEGFLRVFLDEGDRMRELLRTATARGLAGPYTRHVLAAFDAPAQPVAAPAPAPAVEQEARQPRGPLTTRELEILRLIAAGLRNQQIADHLSISSATVKRHIANAYGKLDAGHRTEALVRAAELNLL